jgi:hypothetical protein
MPLHGYCGLCQAHALISPIAQQRYFARQAECYWLVQIEVLEALAKVDWMYVCRVALRAVGRETLWVWAKQPLLFQFTRALFPRRGKKNVGLLLASIPPWR